MSRKISIIFLFTICFLSWHEVLAQKKDTVIINPAGISVSGRQVQHPAKDTADKYNPNKAIFRSAVIPGWGQVTNKKIWKVPLIYAALGITGGIFFHDLKQYKDAKKAYILASDTIPGNDYLIKEPYYSVRFQPDRIRVFRNQVRQNIDYSVLFFIAFWGLNVADAAVDAHLKTFDVSDNLGLEIKPGHSNMANTDGISLVLHIGK